MIAAEINSIVKGALLVIGTTCVLVLLPLFLALKRGWKGDGLKPDSRERFQRCCSTGLGLSGVFLLCHCLYDPLAFGSRWDGYQWDVFFRFGLFGLYWWHSWLGLISSSILGIMMFPRFRYSMFCAVFGSGLWLCFVGFPYLQELFLQRRTGDY